MIKYLLFLVLALSGPVLSTAQPTKAEQDSLLYRMGILDQLTNDVRLWTTNVVTEVFRRIETNVEKTEPNPASVMWGKAQGIVAGQDIPGAGVIAWIMGAVVDSIAENPPPDFNTEAVELNEMLDRLLFAFKGYVAQVMDDPVKHWNDEFTIPFAAKNADGSARTKIRIGELISFELPKDKPHESYIRILDQMRRAWRYTVAAQEIPKYYRIAYYYFEAQDCALAYAADHSNKINMQSGSWVFSRTSFDCWGPASVYTNIRPRWGGNQSASSTGSEDRKTMADFHDVVKAYNTSQEPSVYIAYEPFTSGSCNGIGWYAYFLVRRQLLDSECSWHINGKDNRDTANSFAKWLFTDNGYGGMINPDGVASRHDVFRLWKLNGYKGLEGNGLTTTSVYDDAPRGTSSLAMSVAPNPVTPVASLNITAPQGPLTIALYSSTGELVHTIFDDVYSGGSVSLPLNTSDCGNGLFLLRAVTSNRSITVPVMK